MVAERQPALTDVMQWLGGVGYSLCDCPLSCHNECRDYHLCLVDDNHYSYVFEIKKLKVLIGILRLDNNNRIFLTIHNKDEEARKECREIEKNMALFFEAEVVLSNTISEYVYN